MLTWGALTVQRCEENCFAVHRSVTAGNYIETEPSDDERAEGKSKKQPCAPNTPEANRDPSPLEIASFRAESELRLADSDLNPPVPTPFVTDVT